MLKSWEQEIEIGTLYEIKRISNNFESGYPQIYVQGSGTVNIYGSVERPSSLSDMSQGNLKGAFRGYETLIGIPNYIYIEKVSDIIDKIILIGFAEPKELSF
jgi:hypothetical protein